MDKCPEAAILGFGRLALDRFLVTDTPGHALAMGPGGLARAIRIGRIPEADTLEQGGSSVANTLCGMARLGLPCVMLGAVGDGATGGKILEDLRRWGVDVSRVERQPGRRSRRCWVVVDRESGERALLPERPEPAVVNPAPAMVEPLLAAGARVLHQSKHAPAALACLEGRAALPHRPWSSFNFGYPPRRSERDCMAAIMASADLVVVSEAVGESLGAISRGAVTAGARRRLGGRGLRIVTLGERGSVAFGEGWTLAIPAVRQTVRDTTGAGDAFHAGVLAWLVAWGPEHGALDRLEPDEIRPAMGLGTFLAASVCRHLGARTGLLDRRELVAFVRTEAVVASRIFGGPDGTERFCARLVASSGRDEGAEIG